jgi:DNA-binding CsgD family transcriptional regulator
MRFDRALTFLDNCTRGTDLALLIDEFHETIRAYGFTSCACGAWIGIGKSRTHRFFFNSWPPGWIEIYNREEFFRDDPFVQESHRRMESYLWTELESIQTLTPRGKEITEPVTLQARDRTFFEMIAHAIHNRCRKQIGFGLSPDLPPMTAREIECMKWVAVSKTNWEIGQVLGISASTVHFHVERAKKKLNKSTRTEAVALLLLHGLI